MNVPDLEISLPARGENVAVIRHVLGGVGDALALHPDVLADLKLAVSEACANAVVHAYDGGDPGLLDLEISTRSAWIDIVVRDHGGGMVPRADSPGLGVGLPLMASLAASLELTNRSDGGTEVRMSFGRGGAGVEHTAGHASGTPEGEPSSPAGPPTPGLLVTPGSEV